jgi:hypothetical protein
MHLGSATKAWLGVQELLEHLNGPWKSACLVEEIVKIRGKWRGILEGVRGRGRCVDRILLHAWTGQQILDVNDEVMKAYINALEEHNSPDDFTHTQRLHPFRA